MVRSESKRSPLNINWKGLFIIKIHHVISCIVTIDVC